MTLRRTFLSLLLIAGVAAAMVTAASMATFTDQVVSESNELEAGTLYLSVDGQCGDREAGGGGAGGGSACATDSFDFSASVKKPGDTANKQFTIVNEGSLNGLLSVSVAGGTSCFTVTTTPNPLPSGAALAAGANTSVTVTVTMPANAGNTCQGAQATVDLTFNLTQA